MSEQVISIIDDTGQERFLGNIPGPLRFTWPEFEAADLIPRSEWPALIQAMPPGPADPFLPYVHDQDGVGQCNCDASVTVVEYLRVKAGLPMVKLSAADLYHRINGGSDRGSLLEDALRELKEKGVGTAETCGTIWQGQGQKLASAQERARFKALEWTLCPTFDHLMTAVFRGFAINSGIMWYNNYKTDGDGWLPERGSGQGGGHSVFGYKPAMRDGKYGIYHQNSWGLTWGVNGRGVFPETAYRGPVGGWFALRVVVDEGGDIPAPTNPGTSHA